MTLSALLQKHSDLKRTYTELDNLSPILFAAKYGMTDYIDDRLSLLSPIELNQMLTQANAGGLTALHFAALFGHKETIDLLLTYGASALVPTQAQCLPIHMIFKGNNSIEIIDQLFNVLAPHGGINAKTSTNDNLAHLASIKNAVHILKFLKINAPDQLIEVNNQSMSPLFLAVLHHCFEATKYLLMNSDKNVTNSQCQTALHIAAQSSSREMIELVAQYLSMDTLDGGGHTPGFFKERRSDFVTENNKGKGFELA